MQRIPIFFIIALILVAFYYYKPLRNIIFPEEQATQTITSGQKPSDKEGGFDELSLELYAVANKLANLQGKVELLKMAQEHPDWFKAEEYTQLPIIIAQAQDDLKQAESRYEKIKIKYAQETVTKIIKESLEKKETKKADSSEGKTKP